MKFKRALITGIRGSGGSYLAEYIAEHQPQTEIHGLSRWHSTTSDSNVSKVASIAQFHECDLNDLVSVLETLERVKPDVIFHLAAHANVRASFITPISVVSNNVLGTLNLFEAVRVLKQNPVIQLCSTSEVYGQVDPKNVPITEACPMQPVSPYAVSKVTQDHLAFAYFKSYNMKIIRTRMFAYINPKRADLFATAFARQVARIEAGLQKELLHGNLESTRTMIDVRDAMEAYWVTVEKCTPGEAYNIGGEKIITVGEFLTLLKKAAKVPIPSRQDPKLLRPADVTLQIPNTSKFTKATSWRPKHSFEESVEMLLDHVRAEITHEMNVAA